MGACYHGKLFRAKEKDVGKVLQYWVEGHHSEYGDNPYSGYFHRDKYFDRCKTDFSSGPEAEEYIEKNTDKWSSGLVAKIVYPKGSPDRLLARAQKELARAEKDHQRFEVRYEKLKSRFEKTLEAIKKKAKGVKRRNSGNEIICKCGHVMSKNGFGVRVQNYEWYTFRMLPILKDVLLTHTLRCDKCNSLLIGPDENQMPVYRLFADAVKKYAELDTVVHAVRVRINGLEEYSRVKGNKLARGESYWYAGGMTPE